MVDLLGARTRRGRSVGALANRALRQADRVGQRRDAGAGPDGEPRPVARASGWRLQTVDTAEIVHAPAPPLRPLSETHSRGLAEGLGPQLRAQPGLAMADPPWATAARRVVAQAEVDLVKGETMTPLERLFAVADDANGIGTRLDIRKWTFMNTDLSCTCTGSRRRVDRHPRGDQLRTRRHRHDDRHAVRRVRSGRRHRQSVLGPPEYTLAG